VDTRLAARIATLRDLDVVTDTITLAFAEDPVWAVAFARSDGRVDHQRALFRLWIEGALRYPWVWMTVGGEAVTIWIPPGGNDMSSEQEEAFDGLASEHLGERAGLLSGLLHRFAAARPTKEPYYYLSLLVRTQLIAGRGSVWRSSPTTLHESTPRRCRRISSPRTRSTTVVTSVSDSVASARSGRRSTTT